ncbi:DNA polymerase Y family protein [Kaistia soli]|nr:DNA polymerase Y family protein [Kaistia soli]
MPCLASNRLRRLPGAPFGAMPAEAPLLITEKVKGALVIAARDPAAIRLGLAPGLTLAEARARIADPAVAEADPAADAALLERIADWCDRYTPLVALDGPGGLMLDLTGVAHLFGGEAAMLEDCLKRLNTFGISARIAIAGSADAARALARARPGSIVPPGGEALAVRDLPVTLLGLDAARSLALTRAGLKTIGDLIDRPRAPLAARFGAECVDRIAGLTGLVHHPISPRRLVPVALAERIFFEPVSRTEDIEATLAGLALDVARLLEKRGEGGRRFEAVFYRVDGFVRRIVVTTSRPNRDAKALIRLFREKLDALSDPLEAGFGFDLVRLGTFATEPFDEIETSLDGRARDEDALTDLVDRLGARFGPEHVLRFVPEDTHIPERRARAVPVLAAPAVRWQADLVAGEPPLRPLSLFNPPEPIEALAEVPDGPPLRFRWRRVLHRVARAEGPERIAPEWWRMSDDTLDRDYYRVEDQEGRRFWLYREGLYGQETTNPRWYLHGLFA